MILYLSSKGYYGHVVPFNSAVIYMGGSADDRGLDPCAVSRSLVICCSCQQPQGAFEFEVAGLCLRNRVVS